MIEIRVLGEDHEAIKKDIAFLAEQFGVVTGEVTIERVSQDTAVGTATGEPPKKRGRKSAAEKAAEALSGEKEPVGEIVDNDPFGTDDDEPEVDLEKLKVTTLERMQRLMTEKGGSDTFASLLTKYGGGVKKFAKVPADVFPKIAADLNTLGVA
jgi:hypothetical protein